MVRLDPDGTLDLRDRHRGGALEQLREEALVLGGKVQDDHEGHAALRGHCRKELLQRREAAGRAAQSHHGQHAEAARGDHVVDLRAVVLLDDVRRDLGQTILGGGRVGG